MITGTPETLLLLSIIQRSYSHVKLAKRYKMHLIILVEYINKWTNRTKIKCTQLGQKFTQLVGRF